MPDPDHALPAAPAAALGPVRFGEFLRDRKLITEEQWLAALADHWSAPIRRPIGVTIVLRGYLSTEIVEAEARVFHDAPLSARPHHRRKRPRRLRQARSARSMVRQLRA